MTANRPVASFLKAGILLPVAGALIASPLQAQSSPTCQFAVTAYAGTLIELETAKKQYRACTKDGLHACKVEFSRIRELKHRLKLARDHLNRYCAR